MMASGAGLRVLTKRNPYFAEDPQIVVFQLDPVNMIFKEVHGSPEALLGYPAERWLEPGFWPSRLHPDDREDALMFCAQCTETGQDHELEYRVIHADGRIIWVHEIMEVASGRNSNGLLTGYLMDITHRVAHERDVHEALDLKEELLRVISQELSQPVSKITDFGDLLVRHLSKQGDDVGSDYAVGLREGIEELTSLVDRLRRSRHSRDRRYDDISRTLAACGTGLTPD